MSKTVDSRVVEMSFDNANFERNVQTSLSTLDKLKNSLRLEDAAKGFENIDKASKNVSFDSIMSSINSLEDRFSTMGVVGMRIIENLTDSLVQLTKKTLSFLTNGIVNGGITRAMNLENAHFQLQGLLKDEKAVEAVMKNVSDAVDGTAYSLDSAAKVASQLAASGMRAGNEMFTSLRAVAGVAAMTNSEYDSIGNIFTTIAGNGRVLTQQLNQLSYRGMNAAATLRDYFNSSAENLEQFYKLYNSTKKKNDDAVSKGAKATEKNIRTMVTNSAISFDIFSKAMDSAFGEHAKKANETFNGALSNIKSALGRIGAKFVSPLIVQNGALVKLFNTFREKTNEINSNLDPIAETFTNTVISITNASNKYLGNLDINKFFKSFYDFLKKLKPSKTSINNLKDTLKGLFAVLDIVGRAFSALFKLSTPLFGVFRKFGSNVLSVTASFGRWLVKLDEAIKKGDVFNKTVDNITGFITKCKKAVGEFFKSLNEKFDVPMLDMLDSVLERIRIRISQFKETAKDMRDGTVDAFSAIGVALANSNFLKLLEAIWTATRKIVNGVAKGLGKVIKGLADALGSANFSGAIDLLNGVSFAGIAVAITKFLKGIKKSSGGFSDIKDFFKGVLDSIKGTLDQVRSCLEAYQNNLKAGTLLKIASAVGILAAAILTISLIDSDKLNSSLGAMTILFADLLASMAIFEKISGKITGVTKSCTAMIAMSIAISILASAMKKVAELEWGDVFKGLIGISGLSAIIVTASKIMSKNTQQVVKGAGSMIIFATAIKVLVSACKDLSSLDWPGLAKGLIGVGVLMTEIAVFLRTAKFDGKTITTAAGMVILASAIKILASACSDFAKLEWGDLAKGLVSIAALLAEITVFTKLTGNANNVISTGLALVEIGIAMKIFASAIKDISTMSWSELGIGLTGLAGALAAVTIALRFIPKNTIGTGLGLIAVSTALSIIASVLKKMGGMQWDEIARGLTALGSSMAILAIGLKLMNGSLSGSAALIVATAALMALTPVLLALGSMSWESIVKGLVSIAGAFAIIGVAGLVLGPLVPTILGLAGAFALIGVGVLGIGVGLLAAGAGLSALAVGFTALATAGTLGATAVVAALTVIITGIADLIPLIIVKVGEGLIALCAVIAKGSPAIGAAFTAVILTVVDALVDCVPTIVDGLLYLVTCALESLAKYTPRIIDAVLIFLIEVLEGIARNLPALIQAGVDVLMAFFAGVIDALSGIDVNVLIKGLVGIGLLSGIMLALSAVAALIPGAMLGVLGMGAIIAELALVLAAVGAFAQIPGLNWLINEGGKLLENIGNAIGSFIGGIIGGVMGGISSQFPQIGTDLSNFMINLKPFIEGAKELDPTMVDGIKTLVDTILELTAADILNGISSWISGKDSLAEFGKQLVPFGESIKAYSMVVSGIDTNSVNTSISAAKALIEMMNDLPSNGGLSAFFSGDKDLGYLSNQLIPFGIGLRKYSIAVSGVDTLAISESANAAKALSELYENIPSSGGLTALLTGKNDISEFGNQLVPFGTSIKEYSFAVDGIKVDAVIASTDAIQKLVSTIKSMTDLDIGGVKSFQNAVNILGKTNMNIVGEDVINSFVKGIKAKQSAVSSSMSTIANNIVKTIGEKQQMFVSAGEQVINKFMAGINAKIYQLNRSITKMLGDANSTIRSHYDAFYQSGSYLVQGFANGISANSYKAAAKSKAMASAAITAAKKELDEHSPSKVFYKIGDFAGIAFVNALSDSVKSSYNAGTEVARAAKNGITSSVNKIADAIDIGIDSTPTIRPVLDLSDVSSGVGTLNGMLSLQPSVGVLSNVGTISTMMNHRNQNASNDDVVSAIKDLKKTIGNGSGDTYNINGVTYDDGSNVSNAVRTLVRAVKVEGRI